MNFMQQRCLSMNRPKKHRRALSAIRQFFSREDGVVSIEAIIVYPLLFWSLWTSYTYFDGYRHSARNLKAAYAIADILSREKKLVTAQYISTMYDLQTFMISNRSTASIRISFLRYDADQDRHYVNWSCERGASFEKLTNATVTDVSDRLPVMHDNATMITVETKDLYTRPFKIGYGDHEFGIDKFIFTQPRGYTQIRVEDPNDC